MAWPLDLFNPAPSPEEVQGQVARILDSQEFARTTRLKELLAFVVGRTLEGRIERLTAHAIAEEVFQRGSSFDPETDSIVRTEAARLRSRLDEYYAYSGRHDRVLIMLNRRDYLPVFVIRKPGLWWSVLASLRVRPALVGAFVVFLLSAFLALAVYLYMFRR